MATSVEEIKEWIDRGIRQGATHMIVVCDTFDHEDYPVFIKPTENVVTKHAEFDGKNMQRVMEVYNLKKPIDPQLKEHRAFNF
jgi:hypothetical protein